MEKKKKDLIKLKFNVTIELDDKWSSNYTSEELEDYLLTRINSSLGFRGQVKKLKLLRR